MLHCPQCGTEYREGYSSCSDCHVLLVREQPQHTQQDAAPEPGDPNKDPFCAFWQGTDQRICAELCTVLDEAGIPHKTVHRQDHLFNFSNQVPYQIGVPASLYEKAEQAVKEAFGSEEESQRLLSPTAENSPSYRELVSLSFEEKLSGRPEDEQPSLRDDLWRKPGSEVLDDSENVLRTVQAADDWYPEDATMQVWSGQEPELAEMISASLSENDIHSRNDELKGSWLIFVRPQDEEHAREIIREIVDATPPE